MASGAFPRGNRLLDMLPQDEQERILPLLGREPLRIGAEVQANLRPVSRVVFPLTGMLSLMASLSNGSSMETATVGNEGMVGATISLGPETAEGRVIGQIEGELLVLPTEHFHMMMDQRTAFRQVVRSYLLALMAQISQSVACNGRHTLNERLARWLLQSEDRAGSATFQLTQEFLSHMLGVRRPSVTVSARTLQQAGLIRYTRGRVEILDRAGLEATSCECYGAIVSAYERLVTPPVRVRA
jgi:CRP-like cAMP-binding protein